MNACNPYEIIIQGLTLSGARFRPSDWSERLAGILSSMGQDNKMSYSPYLRPMMLDGVRCVAVHRKLEVIDARAFKFMLNFAHDNHLVVMDCHTLQAKVDAGVIHVDEGAVASV